MAFGTGRERRKTGAVIQRVLLNLSCYLLLLGRGRARTPFGRADKSIFCF